MENPKILQLCAIDETAGSLLKPLILRTMAEGYEVHTVCTDTGKFEALRSEGFHMIDVTIDRVIHPVKNAKSIFRLYKLMKQEQYDIVHVHTPIAALLGRVAAKLAGVKTIVYTAHGFYFHDGMPPKQYKMIFGIEKYAARWLTDWLLLQSVEDYQLSLDNRFKLEDRTIHLSNGVDIWEKFNEDLIPESKKVKLREELQLQEEDIVFAFIGRMVREKGIFELVEAFVKAAEQNPRIKLLVIGGLMKSERDQDSHGKLIEQMNHPRIHSLGFRTDIPELMAVSDVFVLPSYREGLPRSIVEAMAMKKPVIATNIRGCREEVFPDENGFLVEKENADELAEAMLKVANDDQLRSKFALKSREIAENLFDEEKVLKKQIDLFQSVKTENSKKYNISFKKKFAKSSMRFVEFMMAFCMLVVLSPLFAFIALLIKLDSPGSVFFTQSRGGLNGRHFTIYKFRTMYENHNIDHAENELLETDSSITKIGHYLRKLSLDELPQLINILKGDMAFIGPRPTVTSQTDNYNEYQKRRLEVKPGVTGLAQINGRNLLTWDQKIDLDIEYIDKKSIKYDLYILFQTAYIVLKSEGVYEDSVK